MIYLVRHTTPDFISGTCYGQADLDVTGSFEEESTLIKKNLPADIVHAYSSPLQRCSKLAKSLFPDHQLIYENDLMELNCGHWEMKSWDAIPPQELDPWMKDFVNVIVPGGESYKQLYERTASCFDRIALQDKPTAIITHAGVIRSILAYITQTPLADSFDAFKLHYGCVVKLIKNDDGFQYEILHNIASVKEQHRPSTRQV